MKKCPFCAEEIQEEAVKCRHCGEFLGGKPQEIAGWRHSSVLILIAIFTLGPFALPLIWKHPRYSATTKGILTAAVLIITIWSVLAIKSFYANLAQQLKALGMTL